MRDVPPRYLTHQILAFPSDWLAALRKCMGDKKWALYVYSAQNGTGKSCFAATILQAYRTNLIAKGCKWPLYEPGNQGGRWMSVPAWISKVRDLERWPAHREAFATTPMLVIDDLAAGRNTPYVVEELVFLLMRRYENNLRTIITSNLPLAQLARAMDPRLASRLQEGILIQAGTVDWRSKPPG